MAPETPKGVSSRLLTMKFMQRAAASNSTPTTPESDVDGHSAKKRKLGHDTAQARFDANFDQASVQAAIDERESKRQSALDKHSSSDTHWTLDTNWNKHSSKPPKQPLQVVYVGYGDLDSSDDESQDDPKAGRTSTKSYKPAKTEETNNGSSNTESSDDDTDADDETLRTPNNQGPVNSSSSEQSRIRKISKSKAKRTEETEKAKQFREKRKNKEVNLGKLTSISSGGSKAPGGKAMLCHRCALPGHRAADCPSRSSQGQSKRT